MTDEAMKWKWKNLTWDDDACCDDKIFLNHSFA